ncbi:hypothetical protein EX30DRAFT_127542 [Ascodesmis nigricans]|uniref:Uncharacterized protein n=1 Tax=Ascodesmis nigricans TaxID=341454 RepID=A0A4S2MNZ9_9PEZI|nr:hypothetical protein EX30DRAFT_127542 [Ascodesmis nigricans]
MSTYFAFKHRCRKLHVTFLSTAPEGDHHGYDTHIHDLDDFERLNDPKSSITPPAIRQQRKTVYAGNPVNTCCQPSGTTTPIALPESQPATPPAVTEATIETIMTTQEVMMEKLAATSIGAISEGKTLSDVDCNNLAEKGIQGAIVGYAVENSETTTTTVVKDVVYLATGGENIIVPPETDQENQPRPATPTIIEVMSSMTIGLGNVVTNANPPEITPGTSKPSFLKGYKGNFSPHTFKAAELPKMTGDFTFSTGSEIETEKTVPPTPEVVPSTTDLRLAAHECTGCQSSLLDTASYICTFPGCCRRFCKTCTWLLISHPTEGGVDGDLAALSHHWKVERGEASAEDAPPVRVFRKTPATGVAWIARQVEMNRRREAEVQDTWGKREWGGVLGESHGHLSQLDLHKVGEYAEL